MVKKDAYVIFFKDEEKNYQVIFPDTSKPFMKFGETTEFMTDYLDVKEYIKKHYSHVKSNIAVCKVKDVLKSELTSLLED